MVDFVARKSTIRKAINAASLPQLDGHPDFRSLTILAGVMDTGEADQRLIAEQRQRKKALDLREFDRALDARFGSDDKLFGGEDSHE